LGVVVTKGTLEHPQYLLSNCSDISATTFWSFFFDAISSHFKKSVFPSCQVFLFSLPLLLFYILKGKPPNFFSTCCIILYHVHYCKVTEKCTSPLSLSFYCDHGESSKIASGAKHHIKQFIFLHLLGKHHSVEWLTWKSEQYRSYF
jgi:hypothetical protein